MTEAGSKFHPLFVGETIWTRVHSNSRFLWIVDTAGTDHVGRFGFRTIYRSSVYNSYRIALRQGTYLASPGSWQYGSHRGLCATALEWRKHGLRRDRQPVSVRLLLRTEHLHLGRFGLGWSVDTGQLCGWSFFRLTCHQDADIELFRHMSQTHEELVQLLLPF